MRTLVGARQDLVECGLLNDRHEGIAGGNFINCFAVAIVKLLVELLGFAGVELSVFLCEANR